MSETIQVLEPEITESVTVAGDHSLVTTTQPSVVARRSGVILRPEKRAEALALLQSFYEEDPQGQQETWALLEKALAEHRP